MKIAFRVDASTDMGYGHVMRSLALASDLVEHGVDVIFICCELPGNPIEFLRSKNYTVYPLADSEDAEEMLGILAKLPTLDALIVDHYGLGHDWERKIRSQISKIIVIDDLAEQKHDCDVLIDYSLDRQASDYHHLVPKHCKLLLGTDYVLLSGAYRALRQSALMRRAETKSIKRILLSMGGTDPKNVTSMVLEALSHIDQPLIIDVVLSSGSSYLNELKEKIITLSHEVHLHVGVDGLAEMMLQADLAIGAGGITSYERCCLGLPALLILIADNQKHNAKRLHKRDAVVSLGCSSEVSVSDLVDAINMLLSDPLQWKRMSDAAARICDGYGVMRVVSRLIFNEAVYLRSACSADMMTVFHWQNVPGLRRFSRNPNVPSLSEHEAWFSGKLMDSACIFNIIIFDGEPVGVLRFDRLPEHDSDFEVSILIAPSFHGKGFAKSALKLARLIFQDLGFFAEAHPENTASHNLFSSAGYTRTGNAYFSAPISKLEKIHA